MSTRLKSRPATGGRARSASAASVVFSAAGAAVLAGCGGPPFTLTAAHDAGVLPSRDAGVDATTLEGGIFVHIPAPDAGGVDAGCDGTADPAANPCVVSEAYGIFVASNLPIDGGFSDGDASEGTGDGSRANPYSRLGTALRHLGTKTRVYVCNALYPETLSIGVAVSVYGGFSCPQDVDGGPLWRYVGGSAQVRSPDASSPALTVANMATGPVTIQDMSFIAPSASAQLPGGTSSIAAFISASMVNLKRVRLIAGDGNDGAAGRDGAANPNFTGLAPAGASQYFMCPPTGVCTSFGGAGATSECVLFGRSVGGDGGVGCSTGLGGPGTAVPFAVALQPGIDGEPRNGALPDGGVSAGDDPGADGLAAAGGSPGPPSSFGTLTSTGWLPGGGGDGSPGNPAQGGAGSSDPLYPNACGAPTGTFGGGGGGAGGCGGAGGQGGGGGGASIALAAFEGTLDLRQCVFVSGAAGKGGVGGAGQDGQAGAPGGDIDPNDAGRSGAHVPGKAGGNGAGGSGGAGGTGGVSAGILYLKTKLTHDDASLASITVGAAGAGGAGGAGGSPPAGASTGASGNPGARGSAGTSAPVIPLQ
jgi:hypothetical protein